MTESIRINAIKVCQKDHSFYVAKLRAADLIKISYVAVRGRDREQGAVQRFLNSRRISGIKDYTLHQGAYPASIILNWVNEEHPIQEDEDGIAIPAVEESAQLIDGQHRIAGIASAVRENPELESLELPVSIYAGLSTKQCANIFLSINTEQKPVPRSLVYDLYQIADEEIVDPAAARARDIVDALNSDADSPYLGEIKVPGSPRRKGGVALSTAVSAIKPLVESKGAFEQVGVEVFEQQKEIIKNFFKVLADPYGGTWNNKDNAFIYASGFTGAIDFLSNRLIPYCNNHGANYKKEFMSGVIRLNRNSLIYQDEVKGVQGKEAPKRIFDALVECFEPNTQPADIQV
ncbi:DNA sulfur modification protein DndB [Halomonas beimenensis]|uniref:DGQHR domain-containing protein n=1 Tax=Halomonas beimenensis TaxID=475662 RepID=A0A291P2X0_9GAMM|nr:DNA sulfur modification protein DndB [Halomonas beimenensis]ATJ81234.1 hypothetical protein BEI_0247 [Halomonas beimenensis]